MLLSAKCSSDDRSSESSVGESHGYGVVFQRGRPAKPACISGFWSLEQFGSKTSMRVTCDWWLRCASRPESHITVQLCVTRELHGFSSHCAVSKATLQQIRELNRIRVVAPTQEAQVLSSPAMALTCSLGIMQEGPNPYVKPSEPAIYVQAEGNYKALSFLPQCTCCQVATFGMQALCRIHGDASICTLHPYCCVETCHTMCESP